MRATLQVRFSDAAAVEPSAKLALPGRPRAPLTLGRATDCTHRLADETVSRHHAAVRWEDGFWVICDLESTNGVYVNGRRVWRAALRSGDHVSLGAATVVVTHDA